MIRPSGSRKPLTGISSQNAIRLRLGVGQLAVGYALASRNAGKLQRDNSLPEFSTLATQGFCAWTFAVDSEGFTCSSCMRGRFRMRDENRCLRLEPKIQGRLWAPRLTGSEACVLRKLTCFCGSVLSVLLSCHGPLMAELGQVAARTDEAGALAEGYSSRREFVLTNIQGQSDDYELPADPKAVVLSLEYGGGLPMPQQKDFKPTPYVRIQADGTVITGGSSPRATVAEMKLTAAELQKLLKGIIAYDKLLEIKPGEIDEAIKATGDRIMVADAPTTTLTVKLANQEVRLRQYASRMVKSQFPQIDSLQRRPHGKPFAQTALRVAVGGQ